MELEFYQQQINRLKSQWPNAYSTERQKILFNAFKDVANFDFRDAVTFCLGTSKSAPLVLDLEKAVMIARNNYFSQKKAEEASVMGALEYAAENNTSADPEFVDRCLKLLDDLYNKRITKKQFDEGCDLIDQAAKIYKHLPKQPTNLKKPYKDDDEEKPY